MKLPSRLLRLAATVSSLALLAGYVVYSHVTPNQPPPDPLGLRNTTVADPSSSDTIDLTLDQDGVEFEGFVNDGTPVPSSSAPAPPGGVISPPPSPGSDLRIITSKSISQPVFSVRKLSPPADLPAPDSRKPGTELNTNSAEARQ